MIKSLCTVSRRIINCIRPYDGFRNRKLLKRYAGFEHNFYVGFWKKSAAGVGATLNDIGYGCFEIKYQNKKTYVFDAKVMLDDHVTLKIAANKPLVLKILQSSDMPTPKFEEYNLNTLNKAQDFLEKSSVKVVVKPANGTGAGRGVTTHINDLKKLKKASSLASIYGNQLLIEEQVEGDSFRLLYIGGEFVDCIRRDQPTVLGDGVSNIKALIKKENDKRISAKGKLTFHPLIIDMDCNLKLKEQGLDVKSIPEKNQRVIVKSVVNQNNCSENHVVRDEVHPDIISLGQQVVNDLGIELGGIDVITSDISVPLSESNGIINEVNTTPGLHHHVLVAEKDKMLAIGEYLLKYIFSR